MVRKIMKWLLIIAGVAIVVPIAFAYAWHYGHPMNFPVEVPHDFSKLGFRSEHQVRFRCGWLIVCKSKPYTIKFIIPAEGNSRFSDSLNNNSNAYDINHPGRYRIKFTDDRTSQVVFDQIVLGERVRLTMNPRPPRPFILEASILNELNLTAGSYIITVENLETVTDFDQPIGMVVFTWAVK